MHPRILPAYQTHVATALAVFIHYQQHLLLKLLFLLLSPTLHFKQMVGGSPCWQAPNEDAVGWDLFAQLCLSASFHHCRR